MKSRRSTVVVRHSPCGAQRVRRRPSGAAQTPSACASLTAAFRPAGELQKHKRNALAATRRGADCATDTLRVGADLASIPDVRRSVAAFGARFLDRVFTPRELVYAFSSPGQAPERLAARFAAKEAAMKVLRPTSDDAIPWRSIEVVRLSSGACALELTGAAHALAGRGGLRNFAVSISHEGDFALAVVIAHSGEAPRVDRSIDAL